MRHAILSLVCVCTVLAHSLARADAVADWNRIALDTIVQSDQRPEHRLNAMATVNVAMFEALNFVRGRYRPHFVVGSPEMHGVSMDAVAAAAAHHVLTNLYPNQEAALDAALRASLDTLPADQSRESGVITGASIAAVIRAVTSPQGCVGELLGEATTLATAPASPDGALQVVRFWSLANPLDWNPIVTELIALRALALDESARIHALASIVAGEAYLIAVNTPDRCAPCIAAASVAHIVASEVGAGETESKLFDTDREIGRAIARSALREYYRPVGEP